MREDLKIIEMISKRGQAGKEVERVYRLLKSKELFLTAYSNIYANKGIMTPGNDPTDTIDGMSEKVIEDIIKELDGGKFQWQPTRRIYIPKRNGKLRPLGMPGWRDKLVQEALKILLEAYYEPQFSNLSHGYRPNRGCHTALKEITLHWRGTAWFIEGDIKGCFDTINHDILLEIIGRKIKDNQLIKLLRGALEAGYLENWQYHQTLSGTPQGGILSPLLANIYLNELDQFMEKVLMPKYTNLEERQVNPEYNQIRYQIHKARKQRDQEKVKELIKERDKLPYWDMNQKYRMLKYVRYADDLIGGFKGPRSEAQEIKEQIGEFTKEKLDLELSDEKTLITHGATNKARFLNYEITIETETTRKSKDQKGRTQTVRPTFRVPEDVIRSWRNKVMQDNKPIHRPELINLSDFDIVATYNVQLYGLVNYYTMALNVGKLYRVKWVWMQSCVKTLATKNKVSVSDIYRKYRYVTDESIVGLKIVVDREEKKPLEATFGIKPIRYNRLGTIEDSENKLYLPNRSQLIDRLQAEVCELCGSQNQIEVHHIRKLKDYRKRYEGREAPKWVKIMMTINRKTLMVCRQCHESIHRGEYDGKKLNS